MKISIQGGGLAGTVLALTLLEKYPSVQVRLEDEAPNVSSRVAAGILNPVTGKRMVFTYRAEDFFPSAFKFYRKWQTEWGSKFLHELPMCRPYQDETQKNDWMGRTDQDAFKTFILDANAQLDSEKYTNPLGVLKTQFSGWLDTNVFLDHAHAYLKSKDILGPGDEACDLRVRAIGFQEKEHWEHVKKNPITPMKGEILTIHSEELDEDFLISGGCFICPIGQHKFKVGATYDGKNINLNLTEDGKSYLIKRLRDRIRVNFTVLNHEVGIRPASWDRRPLLGYWDENTYVFNGLGSKGVSMAPFLALLASNHILKNEAIPEEMSLTRIKS